MSFGACSRTCWSLKHSTMAISNECRDWRYEVGFVLRWRTVHPVADIGDSPVKSVAGTVPIEHADARRLLPIAFGSSALMANIKIRRACAGHTRARRKLSSMPHDLGHRAAAKHQAVYADTQLSDGGRRSVGIRTCGPSVEGPLACPPPWQRLASRVIPGAESSHLERVALTLQLGPQLVHCRQVRQVLCCEDRLMIVQRC
jgi:hypothetical protein